jgi:hypothetical protein
MERDVVPPQRPIKLPIPGAPMNRDLRPGERDFRYTPTSRGESDPNPIEDSLFPHKRNCI